MLSVATMKSVRHRPFGLREALLSFAGLWLVWALLRWPAFLHPFWIADDFSMWDGFTTAKLTRGGGGSGRLLNGVWLSLYFLFPPPEHMTGSVVLRALQGLLHSSISLLLLACLARHVPRIGAWAAVLMFHLWAFNSEATIWFAGSIYPLAMLLSVGGVTLIAGENSGWRFGWCLLGSLLVAASIHSNQAAAMGGACVWLMLSAFRLLSAEEISARRWIGEGLWIGCGYVVGAALSLWAMHHFGGGRHGGDWILGEKVVQLGEFWKRLWLFPNVYPGALQIAHGLLIGMTLASLGWAVFRRWISIGQALALLGCFLALAIFPFAANLAAPESAFPVRVLYAGTLVWVAMVAWLFWFARCLPLLGWVGGGLVASIILWNAVLSVREAAEFSEIYRRDLANLERLEAFAAEHGTSEVLFMDWVNSGSWKTNPYDLDLHYAHTVKVPVFQSIYWNYRFLNYYSDSLENTPWWPIVPGGGSRWDRLRAKYSDFARALPRDEWIKFVYMEEEDLVLVVPR